MTEPHEQDLTDREGVILEPDEQEEADAEEAEQEQAPEPEPEPEPEAIRSDLDMEKALKALAKESARHADRVSQIMGEDFGGLVPCPMCWVEAPGFRFNVMPQGDQLAAIKLAIGEPVSPEYEKDRYSNVCSACDGYGRTRTGSKVPGQGDVTCYECAGRGWVAVGTERASGSLTVSNGAQSTGTAPPPAADLSEPPEAAALKALGYIVVAPVPQGA